MSLLEQGTGPDDLQKSLPNSASLGFWHSVLQKPEVAPESLYVPVWGWGRGLGCCSWEEGLGKPRAAPPALSGGLSGQELQHVPDPQTQIS